MTHILRHQVVKLRNTPPAKAFYVGCAVVGFHRGFKFSKYNIRNQQRLFVDRLCWGALCARLYTWGHPIVFYFMLRELERKIRSKYDAKSILNYEPCITQILDIPHKEYNY
jgi:hypothetical protein